MDTHFETRKAPRPVASGRCARPTEGPVQRNMRANAAGSCHWRRSTQALQSEGVVARSWPVNYHGGSFPVAPKPASPPLSARLMSVLEAIQVWKEYGGAGSVKVQALAGVDARVEAGEFLAIMGPSGCGKSSLLHLLGGVDTPTAGRVLFEGADFSSQSDQQRSIVRRRRLGFVFQKMNLLPTLTALENVALPLRIDGVARKAAHERARAVLERVELAGRTDHFPHEMSGGEQQRVAIARALVVEPAVLLADEPTGRARQRQRAEHPGAAASMCRRRPNRGHGDPRRGHGRSRRPIARDARRPNRPRRTPGRGHRRARRRRSRRINAP